MACSYDNVTAYKAQEKKGDMTHTIQAMTVVCSYDNDTADKAREKKGDLTHTIQAMTVVCNYDVLLPKGFKGPREL